MPDCLGLADLSTDAFQTRTGTTGSLGSQAFELGLGLQLPDCKVLELVSFHNHMIQCLIIYLSINHLSFYVCLSIYLWIYVSILLFSR